MPGERHDDQVEQAEDDQPGIVEVGEAIELVGDEQGQDGEGRGVGPQLLAQEADHEREVDRPVAEEEEGVIIMLGRGEAARDPVVRVDALDEAQDRRRAEQRQREPAGDLHQRVQAFEGEADDEQLVDALFPHAQANARPAGSASSAY